MSMDLIKTLRERTGAGMLDCKKALAENGGDMDKAVDWLRSRNLAATSKKATRAATEGIVEAYIHAGGKIGVLVEINCETDFVAINEKFRALAREIAMHIAASGPEFLRREDVPADAIERERTVQLQRVMGEGKPEHVAAKIVDGRMGKFYEEKCLLEQKFIKDETKTIKRLISDAVGPIGENIQIRRFVRFEMGEGLEKKQNDFAAEVAAAAGMR